MKPEYQKWLKEQGLADTTIQTQIDRAKRVEKHYNDLDEHYNHDQLRSVIVELTYTAEDQRRGKSNPSKIPIEGNILDSLASLKNAIQRYCKFRRETSEVADEATEEHAQLLGLERDMQTALRRSIEQLEPGLEIIDDGVERSVSSGFIDITSKDTMGKIVVIELKTGIARQKAIGQILSYMGNIADEEPDAEVRGILIAADFDKKTRAAARAVPALSLRAYRVNFEFTNVDGTSSASRT